MERFLTTFIAFLLLTACGQKGDNKDKLVATQWCTVDNMTDSFQIVTRYQFNRGTPNKTNISYLRISDNGSPVIYNVEKGYEWVSKTDDFVWSDKYTVELIEDGLKVNSLDGADKQKAIFEQILKKNPNLKATSESFNPQIALSVKYRSLLSAEDSEQVLYPCSSYAPSFTVNEPVRPIMEFNVFFGQSTWEGNSDLKKSGLAKKMSFQFPMEQLNTADVAVEGSSWCSWFQMDHNSFMMNIVTFGKGQFIQSELTDFVFRDDYFKEGDLLSEMIERARIYSVSEDQNICVERPQ